MLNIKSAPDDYASLVPHELANLLPMQSASEFANLKADIAANGLLQPIWLFEGRILDGRNRYRACRELNYSFGPGAQPAKTILS
jgi:ParB-like chromosome segregation protein Spo0J